MPTLRPGDRAPDVTLPAADRDGVVSLTDYRGKQPVLLALYRSLSCLFCRRQMSRLALSVERLERSGVATLAVVATAPERARTGFDGFEPVESDRHDAERDRALMIGQFLIDAHGIVRWVHIERTPGERLEEEQLLAAL